MPKINRDILVWARNLRNLELEEAAKKAGISPNILGQLEAGDKDPTRQHLTKLSKAYWTPLITFYLKKPPNVEKQGADFRTLPDIAHAPDMMLADVVMERIDARQAIVRDLLVETEEATELPWVSSITPKAKSADVAEKMSETLQFDRAEFRRQGTRDDAFKYLRSLAERAGVYVVMIDNLGNYHTEISPQTFRGFALADPVAPFIAVNSNDSRGAWIFTLMHEFVHLMIGETGVSGPAGSDNAIEKFCDDVASRFLVPAEDIAAIELPANFAAANSAIAALSMDWNVSGTMIAYRIYRGGAINYEEFQRHRAAFYQRYLEHKEASKSDGGTYYTTKQHRVGKGLITFISRLLYDGVISSTTAGRVLDVKPQNLSGLIDPVAPGGIPKARKGGTAFVPS